MTSKPVYFLFCLLFTVNSLWGQDLTWGPGYQTIIGRNPAFAGSRGDGILNLSYINYYPGNGFNLHSVIVSWDQYFSELHGGAAVYLSNDYMGGIMNDIKGGFSYSYHLRAGENMYINAGLTASVLSRGFRGGSVVLPDQIDPFGGVIIPTSDIPDLSGRTIFDIGAGFLLISGRYLAAVSFSHLAKPDLSGEGVESGRLNRRVTLNCSSAFGKPGKGAIILAPAVYFDIAGSHFMAGAGTSAGWEKISGNLMVLTNKAGDVDFQTGLSFNTGRLEFYYNYVFNATGRNNMLPASLIHQAGIELRLNNVDKRKTVKTINFPKL